MNLTLLFAALFDSEGLMKEASNLQLAKYLQESQTQQKFQVVYYFFLDGRCLIQRLLWNKNGTFKNASMMYVECVQKYENQSLVRYN